MGTASRGAECLELRCLPHVRPSARTVMNGPSRSLRAISPVVDSFPFFDSFGKDEAPDRGLPRRRLDLACSRGRRGGLASNDGRTLTRITSEATMTSAGQLR